MSFTEPITRRVDVTITRGYEVTLKPSLLGGLTEEEFIKEWSKGLWKIDSLDDVCEYAAESAALDQFGCLLDGIGLLGHEWDTAADVTCRELYDDRDIDIVD